MSRLVSFLLPRHLAAAPDALARVSAALIAALIGVVVLFGVGFAQPETVHDATHDSRHAAGFPCH
ncbi:MAG: CbtB-domain containing protein [SAR324 cluster bacterium]|nr:CbtB-domain containing protein [SAR324 cluster bacterium]